MLSNFFFTFEFNYIIICIKLCRCVERNEQLVAHICLSHMVAASSSISEDDISLGANQEEAPAPSTDAASSSAVS